MTIVKNPYRLAREVENDALARMTGPSPREEGWDTGFAAAICAVVEELRAMSDEWLPVEAANYNDPRQTVISGAKAAVDRACELLKAAGAKRALPLAV